MGVIPCSGKDYDMSKSKPLYNNTEETTAWNIFNKHST